jgi:hypothetical protein
MLVGGAFVALRRAPGSDPGWQDRATGLLSAVDQLSNHLTAMTPAGVRSVAAADSSRLAILRAQLSKVITDAPTEEAKALMQLTVPLADLHASLDAISLGTGPMTDEAPEAARLLAARLHTAAAATEAQLTQTR